MRQRLREQEIAVQKLYQDAAFELQRRDLELERKTHLVTELEDVVKRKDLEAETLQSELARVKQKAVFDLEKERAACERQTQSRPPFYSEAPQTNPYNMPPAARWAATG